MYDIFISYKRKGASSATSAFLYKFLVEKGYNVFFDRKEMRSGNFDTQLLDHISKAKDIIILLEDESLASWFNNLALHQQIEEKKQKNLAEEGKMMKNMASLQEEPYKTDWFCREVMHALSLEDKNIVPILLNGYQMPEGRTLPPEMRELSLKNALSFDISEIDEFYQKYFVEKEYLKSKPQNLAISRQFNNSGSVVGRFMFYTDAESCDLYECGEKIYTITDSHDEDHPFQYPVSFAGEHRFLVKNNDTCEELKITREILVNCQTYVPLEWKQTQNLWKLTEKNIKRQSDESVLCHWGECLFGGTTKNAPDLSLSIQCLTRAIELGSKEALSIINKQAKALVWEDNADESVISWYQTAAELESKVAQCVLGRAYLLGRGIPVNYYRAVELFGKSAEQGYAIAQYELARCYYEGDGVTYNLDEAIRWFTKAAKQGITNAQYELAFCYAIGVGVEENLTKAVEWYTKAAEHGNAMAQSDLALCYKNGEGVEKNLEKAVEWNTKAAEQGYAAAQYNLALCYKYGEGVEQDLEKAVEWFTKAAEQGIAVARFKLAFCYEKGDGVEKNLEKAVEWYTKAAEQGEPYSQNGTAWCLQEQGKFDEALSWILKAVEQDPEEPNFRDTLATVYQGLRRYDDALEQFKEALRLFKEQNNEDSVEETKEKIANLRKLMR